MSKSVDVHTTHVENINGGYRIVCVCGFKEEIMFPADGMPAPALIAWIGEIKQFHPDTTSVCEVP